MTRSKNWRVVILFASFAAARTASAGSVDIGGGWTASWDNSLDPVLNVVSNGVSGDAVFFQKFATYSQAPVNGVFQTLPIVFTQNSPNAVSSIVINDEVINNNTGEDWYGFNFVLQDNGAAPIFDPVATSTSGGPPPIGFSLAPFTTGIFGNVNTRLDIAAGTVSNGTTWYPGDGAFDGQLWIDVSPALMFGTNGFTLLETPVPEPSTIGLATVVAGTVLRRRAAR